MLSGGRPALADHRALRRHPVLHGADADPRLHQGRARVPGRARPQLAEAARHGRRADQPRGLGVVLEDDRRRPLPGGRHLVADRDRRHHDHPAARSDNAEAGLGDAARSRASRRRSWTTTATRSPQGAGGYLVLKQPWPGMFRTLYGDDERYVANYFSRFDRSTYFAGDGARVDEDGCFWLMGRIDDVMNVSGHRLSTTELESALVEHPAVAEAAATAASGRAHRPDAALLRAAARGLRAERRAGRRAARVDRREDRQDRPAQGGDPRSATCPRPARARSCGACCATSPRATSWATPPRCAIPAVVEEIKRKADEVLAASR